MNAASEPRDMLGEIKRQQAGLPKRQGALARYILRHPETATTISLQQLCRACSTSEPVVFAFCRRLGCRGFRDFKTALAGDLGARRDRARRQGAAEIADAEFIRSPSPEQIYHNLAGAYQDSLASMREQMDGRRFQRAVDLLDKAERIVIIGVGVSGNVGYVALQNFLRTGTAVTWTNDPNLSFTHLAPLKRNDVCLVLSQSGRQRDTIEGAAFARERKIKVIAITSRRDGPLAELADVLLLTQPEPTPALIHLSIGAELALPVLFLTDALAIALGARRKRALEMRSEWTRKAMEARNLPIRRSQGARGKRR